MHVDVFRTILLFLNIQCFPFQTLYCNACPAFQQRKFPLIKLKGLKCKISIFVFPSKQSQSDHRRTQPQIAL